MTGTSKRKRDRVGRGPAGRERRYLPRPHVSLTVQTEVGQEGVRWKEGVKLKGSKAHQSQTYIHTHRCMGTNNHSVMVECLCVTERQVRGLMVTWLSVELCHSYPL